MRSLRLRHALSMSAMTVAAFAALSQQSAASAGTGPVATDALTRPQAPARADTGDVSGYQRMASERLRTYDEKHRLYVLQHARPSAPKVVFAQQPAVREAPAPVPTPTQTRQAPVAAPQQASGSVQGYAESLVGPAQFACLEPLWERESGWNASAENPGSGAYGIPQALPGDKMASAGADWQTDAETQVRWGVGYIDSTYGSPCGAWQHEEADGWY